MTKMDITKTELIWPGKFNEDGTRRAMLPINLPFQVIERVNESRAKREAKKEESLSLFDVYDGQEGTTFENGWRNKLIWGDNLLVMSALLERFAGKIDLIYIDPPFATGIDFSVTTQIGEDNVEVKKEQSILEEKAYRDTWGRGLDSYLGMLYDRLIVMRHLLSPSGSIYLHCDLRANSYIRLLMEEIFGSSNFRAEIMWKKATKTTSFNNFGSEHDTIFVYAKDAQSVIFNQLFRDLESEQIAANYVYVEDQKGNIIRLTKRQIDGKEPLPDGRRFRTIPITNMNKNRPNLRFEFLGHVQVWAKSEDKLLEEYRQGLIFQTNPGTIPVKKQFLDENLGVKVNDTWLDIPPVQGGAKENRNYPTQKPEALLERVIKVSSNPDSLVLDCFCGSGTTLAVAERLHRRWIGCDLGKFGIHTTRKRLLDKEECRPFEILNLGKYERQYWQGVTFGDGKAVTEQSLYEYLAFVLKLYGADPISGMANLHGRKNTAMVHIGAVDAPVTIDEINLSIAECIQVKQKELHVLGWEWEMGLYELVPAEARKKGIKLVLLQIPNEAMEQQAVDKGDIQFFELAYVRVVIEHPKSLSATVRLKDFVVANTELIPEQVRAKVKKWSDYIDYWAVDWDFQGDTFMQGWVTYRTRQNRSLALTSDPHAYKEAGTYRVLVKVIDIFGNDTSQVFSVEVKA